MDFLPEGYQAPATSTNYLKLEDGENKFRILAKPVIGWLDWRDNKPMRFKMESKPAAPVDPAKPIRHFWALLVWSYNHNAVMILEITQSTIQAAITNLSKDSDWGAPYGYDLKINKKGKEKNTEYSVTPSPKKKLDEAVYKIALDKPVNLNELFVNGDPFNSTGGTEIQIDPFQ
jgi:hypothetical protein